MKLGCRTYRKHILDSLYGSIESDRRSRLQSHLDQCVECLREYTAMKETLEFMRSGRRPQPEAAFWDGMWSRFMREVRHAPPEPRRRLFQPRWAWGTVAALCLVLAGMMLERLFHQGLRRGVDQPVAITSLPVSDAVDRRVDEYLERSKRLLMGLTNLDPATESLSSFSLRPEKEASRKLLEETHWLRREIRGGKEVRLEELVSRLEVILLLISNLDENQKALGLDIARVGIRDGAILFQINLEEMRRASERPSPAGGREAGPPRSARTG